MCRHARAVGKRKGTACHLGCLFGIANTDNARIGSCLCGTSTAAQNPGARAERSCLGGSVHVKRNGHWRQPMSLDPPL